MKQITPEEIRAFYGQYKSNLRIAKQLESDLLQPQTQKESWIALLKHKSLLMRNLYAENEATLNRYIRPFAEGKEEFAEDTAEVFLEEIIIFLEEGMSDSLVTVELLKPLAAYYEGRQEEWITCLYYKAYSEQYMAGKKHLLSAYYTYQQILTRKEQYFNIPKFRLRRLLLLAMYHSLNCLLMMEPVNFEQVCEEMDEMLEFWNSGNVRELDGKDFEFDEYIRRLQRNFCQAFHEMRNNCTEQTKLRIYHDIDELFLKMQKEEKQAAEIDNVVYFCYYWGQKERGLLSGNNYFEKIYEYYQTLKQPSDWEKEEFYQSGYFTTMLNFMPVVIQAIDGTTYPEPEKSNLKEALTNTLLKFYEKLPLHNGDSVINLSIFKGVREVLQFWTDYDKVIHVLLHITVYRNIITSIHSIMTSRLAEEIIRSILRYHPEFCIGCLGAKSVEEVRSKSKKIIRFAREAALCHDIGKIAYSDLVNLQTRRITNEEFSILMEHPVAGYRFLRDIPILSKFKDVALGHHKYYDSTGGYPMEFNNISSPDRFFIDLITVCDCTDAATDVLGRNYAKGKSFPEVLEELRRDEGYRYSPKLVEAIADDEALIERLSKLTTEGRIEVFYDVYQDHILMKPI